MKMRTRGERNNNPGNIRPAGYKWQGQVGIDSGTMGDYVMFATPVYGIRAVAKDLLTKYRRGLNTVDAIINVYAPPSENDTQAYIDDVVEELEVRPHEELNLDDPDILTQFVKAIIKHENGRILFSEEEILTGVEMALLV